MIWNKHVKFINKTNIPGQNQNKCMSFRGAATPARAEACARRFLRLVSCKRSNHHLGRRLFPAPVLISHSRMHSLWQKESAAFYTVRHVALLERALILANVLSVFLLALDLISTIQCADPLTQCRVWNRVLWCDTVSVKPWSKSAQQHFVSHHLAHTTCCRHFYFRFNYHNFIKINLLKHCYYCQCI